jgi:calcineurin-like phosphoesterase
LNIKSNLHQAKVGEGSRVIKIKNKKVRITNLLGLSTACKNMQTNPFLLLDEKLSD